MFKLKELAVALRFFGSNPETVDKDIPRLGKFLDETAPYGKAYVAVNTAVDVTGAIAFMAHHYPEVTAFGVTPWQKFVAPCNALIYAARKDDYKGLLSASTEFPLKREFVEQLLPHLDEKTLFVGARFPEHTFEEGEHEATGSSFPWGTFGVWNLEELAKLGMPMTGDAPFDVGRDDTRELGNSGVEEFSTVGLFQERYLDGRSGFPALAKLVTMKEGFYGEWKTEGWDEARHAAHEKKIASKSARPAKQLAWAGIRTPQVIHIA